MADLNRRAFLVAVPATAAVAAGFTSLGASVAQSCAASLPSVASEAEHIVGLYAKQGTAQRAALQAALREEGMIELADAFEACFPSSGTEELALWRQQPARA